MAWLQALPWELPTEKVTSRIGPFLIFPFTVHVLFSFDFFVQGVGASHIVQKREVSPSPLEPQKNQDYADS